jgi:hypothetical protein
VGFAPNEGPASEFTISTSDAPLVEVSGHGSYADREGGLSVPAGIETTAPVKLLTDFIRAWRVDAPSTIETTVRVVRSPFGALVGVRRCMNSGAHSRWSVRCISFRLWPGKCLLRLIPLTTPCEFEDIGDGESDEVTARGGDVVVVEFVVP